MPKGERASLTALATAAVEAMVPASPAPFTPNGFTGDGVQVAPVSKFGRNSALGSA